MRFKSGNGGNKISTGYLELAVTNRPFDNNSAMSKRVKFLFLEEYYLVQSLYKAFWEVEDL